MNRSTLITILATSASVIAGAGVTIAVSKAKMKVAQAAPPPSALTTSLASVASSSSLLAPPSASSGAPRSSATTEHTFVGVLLPPQMANVGSRAEGRLLGVPVKVGQVVRKGDVVAVFDARERKQELAVAEGQLKAAQGAAAAAGAELGATRARAARRNANTTVDVGGKRVSIVSGEEAAQSEFDARGAAGRATAAAGQVQEHKARIAALKIALEESELRAPFDGVVAGSYFEPGMTVRATETVVRVVGGGRGLRVRMAVPEDENKDVSVGRLVRVALDDGRSLSARLQRISPEVDTTTRSFFVEGDVELAASDSEQDVVVLAGRTVRVTLLPRE